MVIEIINLCKEKLDVKREERERIILEGKRRFSNFLFSERY